MLPLFFLLLLLILLPRVLLPSSVVIAVAVVSVIYCHSFYPYNQCSLDHTSNFIIIKDSLEPERDGVAPKFVLTPNKMVDACITCTARMECKAVGEPKPDVRWYKEKLPIISNGKFTVYTDEGGVCTLTVDDVYYEDEGTYKAIATNDAGKASCVTKLIVKGR